MKCNTYIYKQYIFFYREPFFRSIAITHLKNGGKSVVLFAGNRKINRINYQIKSNYSSENDNELTSKYKKSDCSRLPMTNVKMYRYRSSCLVSSSAYLSVLCYLTRNLKVSSTRSVISYHTIILSNIIHVQIFSQQIKKDEISTFIHTFSLK